MGNLRQRMVVVVAVLVVAGCSALPPAPEAPSPTPGIQSPAPAGDLPAPDVPPLHPAIDDLDETVVVIVTPEGDEVRVDAKVAAGREERQRGLMEVEALPDGTGMLFVFDDDRTGGFWMRDTLVPLDIAYIAADGTIGTILAMDPCTADDPRDCEVYAPQLAYRTALEVPQGWFDRAGVAEGAEVRWNPPVPASP